MQEVGCAITSEISQVYSPYPSKDNDEVERVVTNMPDLRSIDFLSFCLSVRITVQVLSSA